MGLFGAVVAAAAAALPALPFADLRPMTELGPVTSALESDAVLLSLSVALSRTAFTREVSTTVLGIPR